VKLAEERCREQRRFLGSLESSSEHTKGPMQIEQRRFLEALRAVRTHTKEDAEHAESYP